MYAKIFASLYQGTLRGRPNEILVFTFLIANADRDGFCDVHPRAIAEAVGLPREAVDGALLALEAPDPESRTSLAEGRRIQRVDKHRSWGWTITNHAKYREIRHEEDRREQNRRAQAKRRLANADGQPVSQRQPASADVSPASAMSAHADADADADADTPPPSPAAAARVGTHATPPPAAGGGGAPGSKNNHQPMPTYQTAPESTPESTPGQPASIPRTIVLGYDLGRVAKALADGKPLALVAAFGANSERGDEWAREMAGRDLRNVAALLAWRVDLGKSVREPSGLRQALAMWDSETPTWRRERCADLRDALNTLL